jgi:uncharacterized protein YpbB
MAAEHNVQDYMVMPMKTLLEISEVLPTSAQQLARIKGIGKTKVMQYGQIVLDIVKIYCDDNEIDIPETIESEVAVAVRKEKPDTKRISLQAFLDGRTMEEIAAERNLTLSTIETHLIHFIETEELDIFALYPSEKVTTITAYLTANRQATLGEAKNVLGDDFSYAEIRACLKYLRTIDL